MEINNTHDFVPTVRITCDTMSADTYVKDNYIRKLTDVKDDILSYLSESNVENIIMLTLDVDMHVLNKTLIGRSQMDSASFCISELVRIPLLTAHCANVMILHNHTSVNNTPSRADLRALQNMFDALSLFNINLSDFIIVNTLKEMYSCFKERIGPYKDFEFKNVT